MDTAGKGWLIDTVVRLGQWTLQEGIVLGQWTMKEGISPYIVRTHWNIISEYCLVGYHWIKYQGILINNFKTTTKMAYLGSSVKSL